MICFYPTKFPEQKTVELTRILQIDDKNPPTCMSLRSPLTSEKLQRLDVYVQTAKEALMLKHPAYQSYEILCAIAPDSQVARACAGLADLVQFPCPQQTDITYLRQFNTLLEYRMQKGESLGEIIHLKRHSRGKNLIVTAPDMNELGLKCVLEQFGFSYPNLMSAQLNLLKNAMARMHRASDGVGLE